MTEIDTESRPEPDTTTDQFRVFLEDLHNGTDPQIAATLSLIELNGGCVER